MVDSDRNLVALKATKERAEALLSERFAADVIDADELERRLERVQAAGAISEVEAVTEDLVTPETALVPTDDGRSRALARPDEVKDNRSIVTVFGEHKQPEGPWVPARHNKVLTVFGDTSLDLREARLGPGTTEISVRCVFGEVSILVPPGLDLEVQTNAILASVELPERAEPPDRSAGAPRVVLTGFVVMGSVEIRERYPGESKREAKKRRKQRRKELKRAARAERKALKSGRRSRD